MRCVSIVLTPCAQLAVLVICLIGSGVASTWSEWWTYDGISGPDFWGLVNPEWSLCSKGKQQSPINIDPRNLLFDPHLKPIRIDKHKVSGTLQNTGRVLRVVLDESPASTSGGLMSATGGHPVQHINISGGPLSYQYRLVEIVLHFGSNNLGSEHTIGGLAFPAEIQLVAYNSDLYGNMSQALSSSNGIAVIALLGQMSDLPNLEFDVIAQHLKLVRYKGKSVRIRHLSINGLLPATEHYMTYEGSLTQPGCQETVTWIIMNKPIYFSNGHLMALRDVMQGDEANPKVPMENNCRLPILPTNNRVVRTNINFQPPTKECTMERQVSYHAVD